MVMSEMVFGVVCRPAHLLHVQFHCRISVLLFLNHFYFSSWPIIGGTPSDPLLLDPALGNSKFKGYYRLNTKSSFVQIQFSNIRLLSSGDSTFLKTWKFHSKCSSTHLADLHPPAPVLVYSKRCWNHQNRRDYFFALYVINWRVISIRKTKSSVNSTWNSSIFCRSFNCLVFVFGQNLTATNTSYFSRRSGQDAITDIVCK
jgi:hypothetical protein